MINVRPTRRQLLTSLGGLTALAALAPLVPRVEAAPSAALPRFLYWYEGVMPAPEDMNALYPANAEGAIAFRGPMASINDIAGKISVVRGLVNRAGSDSGDVGPHPKGGATFLVGRAMKSGADPIIFRNGKRGVYGFGKGVDSLDQFLVKHLGAADLRVGLNNTPGKDGDVDRSISILDGQVMPRHQSPLSVYDDLFRNLVIGGSGNPTMQASDVLRQRKSVLDFARGSLGQIKTRVSHFDQHKIDAHLESIRATEVQLDGLLSGGGATGPGCSGVAEPATGGTIDQALPLYGRLIAQAFACDLVRIAGGHFGRHTNIEKYAHLPAARGESFHPSTHSSAYSAFVKEVMGFRGEMFKAVVNELAAVPEEDGTLLDSTICWWTSDSGKGHDHDDYFTVLAGGTSRFKHGKMAKATGTTNLILTSVAQFMGADINSFGDEKYGAGTLPAALFA